MDVDSAYRYLFSDPAERYRGLERLFDRNLHIHLSRRCTYVGLDESGRVAGTVTLRPPHFIPISTWTMLRRGLLPFALQHGRSATRRLFWLKDKYDALEAELAGHAPHWYVHMMAVQPDLQGRGVGTELLARAMEDAVPSKSTAPVVLTTHLRENLVFYQRARFRITWEQTVQPPGGAPYPVWGMTLAS